MRAARHCPPHWDAVDLGLLALRNMAAATTGGLRRCARRRWGGVKAAWRLSRRDCARHHRRLERTARSSSRTRSRASRGDAPGHAVILVGVDDVSVMGVVVNKPPAPAAKPEGVALGEAVGDGQDGDREGVAKLGPLGASRIFTGGDVQQNALLLLHDSPSCAHSASVGDEPSLFYTSRADVLRDALHARCGSASASRRAPAGAGYGDGGPAGAGQARARRLVFARRRRRCVVAPVALAPSPPDRPPPRCALFDQATTSPRRRRARRRLSGDHGHVGGRTSRRSEAQTEELPSDCTSARR